MRQVGQGVVVQRAGIVCLAAELHRQVGALAAHRQLQEGGVHGLRGCGWGQEVAGE